MKYLMNLRTVITCCCIAILAAGAPHPMSAQKRKSAGQAQSAQSRPLPAVVVVSVKNSETVPATISGKVDAAFALAMFASEKFRSIPFAVRDSVLGVMRQETSDVTAGALAQRLGAEQVAFVTVNRLQNILRVAVSCRYGKDFEQLREGIGYAVLKYRKGSEDSILYDPSLLLAIQRAFALSQADTLMYAKVERDMRAIPAKLLAPTHLEFVEKVGTTSTLFEPKQKPIVAYDAMQTMFIAAKDHPLYVPLDVDTRDSIYALANLYEVENENPPNVLELRVLFQVEIRTCLMAKLTQENETDLSLEMKLCEILSDGNLRLLRQEKSMLSGDKLADLRKGIQRLTKKILRER